MSKYLISILFTMFAVGFDAVSGNALGEPLYIYKDAEYTGNHGGWGNMMPARAAETSSIGFKSSISPGFGGAGTAVQVVFDLKEPPNWVGLVVPVEDGYWGEQALEDATKALDLSKAKKLVFYAKGDQGAEQIQIKAAIASDRPFGDSADLPVTSDWFILEKDWKQYEVPVDGRELKRVVTPFVLISNLAHNPAGRIKFYVDEIYYELGE